ncbi:MAG: TerC family protein [Micropepsaceae bacterium]
MEFAEFLFTNFAGWPIWLWLSFVGVVIALLAFDLGVLHRKEHEIGVAESLLTSLFYVGIGIAFSGVVYLIYFQSAPVNGLDPQLAIADNAQRAWLAVELYLTGFILEKTLALDNIFVISLIFSYFAIPRLYQHRVLFWGIIGVIVLRAAMIGVGATLVAQASWVLYVFSIFLIWTGVMMLRKQQEMDLSKNPVLTFIKRRIRVTDTLHGNKFFVRKPDTRTGRVVLWATSLFLALVMIELADLVFAIDSVPAIFALTSDPFIVYTSNIFAILGLRALYFALAAMIHRFQYLKYALAATLIFIGAKIFAGDFFPGGKVPAEWSLAITTGLLAIGILFSLLATSRVPVAAKRG